MPEKYLLSHGSHKSREDGLCAMEWISYLAGEPHSASPGCVSEMLTSFGVRLNDALPDDQRQRLRPYLARMIGTRGDGLDDQRRWMCADWLIREYTPTFLALVPGLKSDAEALRSLPPVLTTEDVQRAMVDLRRARGKACAARDPARVAARDVAWDVAGAAAWDAGAAAWAAARDVAGAGWAAAWAAAWKAAWKAAGAARAAARAAARDPLGAAAGAAWDATWAAAGAAMAPAVAALQDSILSPGGLLDRMLPTEVIQLPVVAEWREVCALS